MKALEYGIGVLYNKWQIHKSKQNILEKNSILLTLKFNNELCNQKSKDVYKVSYSTLVLDLTTFTDLWYVFVKAEAFMYCLGFLSNCCHPNGQCHGELLRRPFPPWTWWNNNRNGLLLYMTVWQHWSWISTINPKMNAQMNTN